MSKPIGVIGGAGPLAGVFLLQGVFNLAMERYGCHKDADFPLVHFVSYPFSEMLSSEFDEGQVREELRTCLREFRRRGVNIIAIACNTLHAFLDEGEGVVHLLEIIREEIPFGEIPLVLCTSTSVKFGLHRRFFPCRYPDQGVQETVDLVIDHILKKGEGEEVMEILQKILPRDLWIVLGCTELSLFRKKLEMEGYKIIDPLQIAAEKLLERSFER